MKSLTPDKKSISPFVVHKQQSYLYQMPSGSYPGPVNMLIGTVPTLPLIEFDPLHATENVDGTYTDTVYYNIRNMFYQSGSTFDAAGQIISASVLGRGYNLPNTGSIYVVSMTQTTYGEGILPGSFNLIDQGVQQSIIDDGLGHLFVSGSISVIGNIFYNLGLAIFGRTLNSGSFNQSGSIYIGQQDQLLIEFKATQTIYEHQYVCTMSPLEFNFSMNNSCISGSSNFGTGLPISSMMLTGSLVPYFTTIGLYDDYLQLLAIAKVPHPIRRTEETDQSIIIRFDI